MIIDMEVGALLLVFLLGACGGVSLLWILIWGTIQKLDYEDRRNMGRLPP